MKSSTTAEFWTRYRLLPDEVRAAARRTYRLWSQNPRAPALRFKKVRDVYAVAHRDDRLPRLGEYGAGWVPLVLDRAARRISPAARLRLSASFPTNPPPGMLRISGSSRWRSVRKPRMRHFERRAIQSPTRQQAPHRRARPRLGAHQNPVVLVQSLTGAACSRCRLN